MVKTCCTVGCSLKYSKESELSFYRFPADQEKRCKWIAAVKRKDWEPNEYTWLCSAHFISGKKSNDPLSPDYIPSVFSVSDKHITENSGILDQILADRGFTIQDVIALNHAEVKLPSFTRGKKQLSKHEVDNSHALSRVRIHVERVIGLLRQKYTILESTLPINMIMCDNDNNSESSSIETVLCFV